VGWIDPELMNYRDRVEIIREMLSVLPREKKIHIMFKARLSFAQFNKYMDYLADNKLLCQSDNGFYLITNKGQELLSTINELISLQH
jgi:predicted transcriptional regulator